MDMLTDCPPQGVSGHLLLMGGGLEMVVIGCCPPDCHPGTQTHAAGWRPAQRYQRPGVSGSRVVAEHLVLGQELGQVRRGPALRPGGEV